jgi:NDP-sugar pyrophosphorylase family protein
MNKSMEHSGELMSAVILAGGLATRLGPITKDIPKAMIEVAGRPFLWHQLTLLRRSGIRQVLVLVGHLGDAIRQHFGDGSALGISIEYSFDGPTLLGTAGAIRRALPLLPQQFFVLYGDSYLTCNYADVQAGFQRSGTPALMTVYRNEGRFDKSNVEFDGRRILQYDKRNASLAMHHIDYGLGAFQREVFSRLPEGQSYDLAVLYSDLLQSRELGAYEVHERFYEIGSLEGLRDTAAYLESGCKPV